MTKAEFKYQPKLFQKLLIEQDELNDKIIKLDNFIHSETFNTLRWKERRLLKKQLSIMIKYFLVLDDRLVYVNTEK